MAAGAVVFARVPDTISRVPNAFAHEEITFAAEAIAFAHGEIAFAAEAITFAHGEIAFAAEAIAFAHEEITFAAEAITFAHGENASAREEIRFAGGVIGSAVGIFALDSPEMVAASATRAMVGAVYYTMAPTAGSFTAAERLAATGENPFGGSIGISPRIMAAGSQLIPASGGLPGIFRNGGDYSPIKNFAVPARFAKTKTTRLSPLPASGRGSG
jgi:hypothetical protein